MMRSDAVALTHQNDDEVEEVGSMKVPFEEEYREQFRKRVDDVFESGFLSEGDQQREFEQRFGELTGLHAVAVSSGGAALAALYEWIGVSGREVIVPANTFWATAVVAKRAGARVVYADCNRDDLCLSADHLEQLLTEQTAAVCVTHVGGHIAFEIERIARLCEQAGVALVEDCAHAHGASYKGKSAGSWGVGGAFSFYATKTLPLGEGGAVVTTNEELAGWVKGFRNYGKDVRDGQAFYPIASGFNYRMPEVVAALGNVQLGRLPEILRWKRELAAKFDEIFEKRVELPDSMESGYYKYIVFDCELAQKTGQVYGPRDLGYNIDEDATVKSLANSEWVTEHHACAPIWYGWPDAGKSVTEIADLLGVVSVEAA